MLPARELVPGDLIRVRLGDAAPADARILSGDPIEVDQAALTGESLPVAKSTGEALFSGSILRRGEADAMVCAIGLDTYFGKTAKLVQEARTVSHFQSAVLRIGRFLICFAAVLVAGVAGVALLRGDAAMETLQFALVLTIASIPVAMPTVLSVTMAVGSRVLAAQKAIVSRLVSIEELSGVDVLCVDKTGTLTQNLLTLGHPFCMEGVQEDQLILHAAWASLAEDEDALDRAVLKGVKDPQAIQDVSVVRFQPFDPVRKRTEALLRTKEGREFRVTKGAPQVILDLSPQRQEVLSSINAAIQQFAASGFRSIGVACAEGDGAWKFLGAIPLFDPPREDAKQTIFDAGRMGIQVKMATGDQMAIAQETAKSLGMGTKFLNASNWGEGEASEEAIEQADGFAQVWPEHKFHIVDVLQKRGHMVGMTGDGVNDAPALKKADCGIAVSGASDAARAAASIVLLAPGLSVILDAIRESRRIFQRMNSYCIYRIAETLRILCFMAFAMWIYRFYPVTAAMIVLLALLNDGAILSIAYDRALGKDRPEAWDMRTVLGIACVLGAAGIAASFLFLYLTDQVFFLERTQLQTMMYLKLSISGHLTLFAARTRGPFWSVRPASILIAAVCGTQMIATLVALFGFFMAPISWKLAGLVWIYALGWFMVEDSCKRIAYTLMRRDSGKTYSKMV